MPDVDGVEATRRIVAADPDAKVVILSAYADEDRILDALHEGARGYVLKHGDPRTVLRAVRAAYAGDAVLDLRAGRVVLAGEAPATAGGRADAQGARDPPTGRSGPGQ